LGGKRWNRLHRLVYLALSVDDSLLVEVKPGVLTPLTITLILGVLLVRAHSGLESAPKIHAANA